jgi:hypothetical protein
LAEPSGFGGGRLDQKNDPRFKAIAALAEAAKKEQLVVVEQNRSDLDLSFSLGVDRYANAAISTTSGADVTDFWGLVGVRYALPLKRRRGATRLAAFLDAQRARAADKAFAAPARRDGRRRPCQREAGMQSRQARQKADLGRTPAGQRPIESFAPASCSFRTFWIIGSAIRPPAYRSGKPSAMSTWP